MYKGTLKIVVSGPSSSGKTLFVNNLCGLLTTNLYPTIGVDFYTTHMNTEFLEKNVDWKIYIWDTSGNKSFTGITKEFYKVCPVCVLVYKKDQKDQLEYYRNLAIQQNEKIYIIELENTGEPHFGRGKLGSIIDSYSKYMLGTNTPPQNIKGLELKPIQTKLESKKEYNDNNCSDLDCTIV